MNTKAYTPLLVLPSLAHASGGDVLSLLWLEVLLFIAAVIFMFISKLTLKLRSIVFLSYLISTFASIWLFPDLPYSKNIVLINSVTILVPIVTCGLVWFWCNQHKKI
jgi:hypothetical protein